LKSAYPFLVSKGFESEVNEIRSNRQSLKPYGISTIRRVRVVALMRSHNLLDQFIEANWPLGKTAEGKKRLERYDRSFQKYESHSSVTEASSIEDESEVGTEFALEEHLRDYLVQNLEILESGLTLWPVEGDGEAIEFLVDEQGPSKRIDILARDQNGVPVIIELKVSRGHERVIGQTLYYRARIKQRFSANLVRIFIVASEISPELRAAVSEVPNTFLFEYTLAMKLSKLP
jgi:hypothetical protein